MKHLEFKSIGSKILAVMIGVLMLMSVVTLSVVRWEAGNSLTERINHQLGNDSQLSITLIDKMYPGDWKLDNGQLYKGTQLINGSTDVVDLIKKATDAPATIFAGDTRVTTNIVDNGKRIVGTKASDQVIQTVLTNGNTFIGQVKILGQDYNAIYIPLKDKDNKIIGMFFLGDELQFINQELNKEMLSVSVVIAIILLFAIGITIFVMRRITKNIKRIVDSMTLMGNGDFTVRNDISSVDEIGLLGETQNKVAEDLSRLMGNIKKISTDLSSSADSLAASSEETSASTEEISRTINEIVNATTGQAQETELGLTKTNELAGNIQGVSTAISEMSDMFAETTALNNKGMETVTLLSEKTERSNTAAGKVNVAINEVDSRSQEISVITQTIKNIADQTNLLSLNASIEAARAGDAGRGFAVVAGEIRKLAEQSALASSQISELIKAIQVESKNAVNEMATAQSLVTEQARAVSETKAIFSQISTAIASLTEEVKRINGLNKAMVDKKDGILNVMTDASASAQQTSAATQQISASTQEQVATIEEVSRTAELLNTMAQDLQKEIQKFNI